MDVKSNANENLVVVPFESKQINNFLFNIQTFEK